ncbi:MAG: HEAT repeat domain-containing protein [Alphaproteobacteria bacterium]|nr:HEAT repeat domain-containing protein [Alphaproteobacteria bacterium]
MTLLTAIWWISVTLVTAPLVTLAGLIARRLYQARVGRRLQERQKALTLLAMIYLDFPLDDRTIRQICGDFDLNFLHRVASGLVEGRRRKSELRSDLRLLRDIVQDLLGSVRGDTRERLVNLLRATSAREICLADLRHRHVKMRIDAIETLALIPDAEIIGALRGMLDDPEADVRLAAAHSLVTLGPNLTVADLVDKLDIGVTIRSLMLREIFRIFASHDASELRRLLAADPPDLVATLCIYALGTAHDYAAVPVIARYACWPSVDIRAESMRALATIGHPEAESAVLQALGDEAWEVRTQAAICAGQIPLPNAVPLLRERLGDIEWWPRFRAAEALRTIGAEGRNALERARLGRGQSASIADMILAEESAAA